MSFFKAVFQRLNHPLHCCILVPHSIPPEADFTVFYILAGLLVSKFVVAVLIFIIGNSRKSRETEWTDPRLSEQQVLPFAGDGISPSWESTA